MNGNSNIKIKHDFKNINEGVEYVMTLEDRNILDGDSEQFEVLENEILNSLSKSKRKEETDIFQENKKFIYDESPTENGFVINLGEKKVQREEIDVSAIKEKLALIKNKNPQNVKETVIPDKKFASDYMTQEEFNKNLKEKPIFKKGKIKKRATFLDGITQDEINITDNKATQVLQEYDDLNLFLEKERELSKMSSLKLNRETSQAVLPLREEDENLIEGDVITETSEFLKNVQSRKEDEEHARLARVTQGTSLKDATSGTTSVVNVTLANERIKYGLGSIMSINEENKKFLNQKRKEIEVPIEDTSNKKRKYSDNTCDMSVMTVQSETNVTTGDLEEPLVRKGVGVALEIFRKRGLAGAKQLWGRYKDNVHTTNDYSVTKTQNVQDKNKNKKYNFNVELNYRDAKGRELTPKEQFRLQCYKFHGEGPGQKKIEKRLIREQKEQQMKSKDTSETPTLKFLKVQQNKRNMPLVVLQGKTSHS